MNLVVKRHFYVTELCGKLLTQLSSQTTMTNTLHGVNQVNSLMSIRLHLHYIDGVND